VNLPGRVTKGATPVRTAANSGAARRRILRQTLSVLAVAGAVLGLVSAPTHPAAAAASSPSSPTTLSGTGPFAGLEVTVSQTQDLINQDVNVTWTGGMPTQPSSGEFYTDYLQIMECWGDDTETGPDPSQCEFGPVRTTAQLGGTWADTRQLTYPSLTDPAETDIPAGYTGPNLFMPFSPAPDAAENGAYVRPPPAQDVSVSAEYYDQSDTDEVDYARTDADGTGHEFFEVDTNREAPGLGCGRAVPDPAAGPGKAVIEPCWLVVVPRGETEVDGSHRTGTTVSSADVSSALSATNWAHRIDFQLTFQPVASACAIGADEIQTGGDEQAADAMARWQPGLCAQDPNSPYSYSEIGDDEARAELASGSPGLEFLSDPLTTPVGQPPPDVLYAPVAVNALTISFYIQSQGGTGAAADRDGVQITRLNLNARLIAKLLTQSYQAGVGTVEANDVPAQNPLDLTSDPEFLALNPAFRGLDYAAHAIPDIIVPFGNADAYAELWSWIEGDPAARAFLSGVPDTNGPGGNPAYSGMVVNPNYRTMQLPIEDFPTSDPYCQQPTAVPAGEGTQTPLCGIALHPYSTSMDQGALAATEGNQLLHVTWGQSGQVWGWVATPAEADGDIGIIALADAATAAKYGLPTARLCSDEAGQPDPNGDVDRDCVAATTGSMLAALTDAYPSPAAPTVLVPNPNTIDPDAYPLTTITYAATEPGVLTPAEAGHYADLLRYIAGPGQVPGLAPGDLALGYAPMPAALVRQTTTAADTLRSVADGHPDLGTTPPIGPPTGPGDLAAVPVPLPAPLPPGTVTRASPAPPLAPAALTAPSPIGPARWVLLSCLLAAGLGSLAGPTLLLSVRRAAGRGGRSGGAGRRRVRWNPDVLRRTRLRILLPEGKKTP
jgi:hypothetical protein